ncbi:hypothetical protein SDJN03_23536, partial [Cucurbita argyrosperma subsp. sororia]
MGFGVEPKAQPTLADTLNGPRSTSWFTSIFEASRIRCCYVYRRRKKKNLRCSDLLLHNWSYSRFLTLCLRDVFDIELRGTSHFFANLCVASSLFC